MTAVPISRHSDSERLAIEAMAARGLHTPLDTAALEAFQERFNQIPAMSYMGCTLDLANPPIVQVHLPEVQTHHRGGMGTEAVNGAVLAGLGDCALGVAGVLQLGGERSGTVEMSIKFLRPTVGHSVVAYAVALKRGGHLVFTEAELYCEGRLCATATGMVTRPTGSEGAKF
jgi:acyl-coenzyme A thioesterase PaaI-like protein